MTGSAVGETTVDIINEDHHSSGKSGQTASRDDTFDLNNQRSLIAKENSDLKSKDQDGDDDDS